MYSVLIVDDEKIVRLALKTMIDWEGNSLKIIGEARDGVSALDKLKENKIDIVITDLKMPNMDGIQLIKNLKNQSYAGKILVLSNYDDYQLVREAMKLGASDYLLKITIEEDEFLESLKQIIKELDQELLEEKSNIEYITHDNQLIIKETFLKNLIINKYKEAEILQNIRQLGLNISDNNNIILFVSMDQMRKKDIKDRITDKNMFQLSVINIIHEVMNNYYQGEVIGLEYRDFIVILPIREGLNSDEKIQQLAKNLLEMFDMYLNMTASIVISDLCSGVDCIADNAARCRNVLEYKFYIGDGSIIHQKDISYGQTIGKQNYSFIIGQLKENLRLGEIEKNIIIFDDILSKAKNNNSHPKDLKKVISIIIESLRSVLVEAGEEDILYMEHYKSVLQNTETLEDYRNNLIHLMEEMYKRIERIYDNKYRKEVTLAIDYIKANIHKKINLSMIAKTINMSESYLSRIFKNETGEGLIKFINHMKIEKAKEIIRNSDIMVKEVAESVGINDQFYFDRLFKKYVGMSPSQYKNKVCG